jgi:hypothetical protein
MLVSYPGRNFFADRATKSDAAISTVVTNSQTRFSVEDHAQLPKHNPVVTFGWGWTSVSGGPGPVSDGVDILVREDLRLEGELPVIAAARRQHIRRNLQLIEMTNDVTDTLPTD